MKTDRNDECWGVFGDDDDDNESDVVIESPRDHSEAIEAIALFLTTSFLHNDSGISLQHKVCHIESQDNVWSAALCAKLRSRCISIQDSSHDNEMVDAVIVALCESTIDTSLLHSVVPGGYIILCKFHPTIETMDYAKICAERVWHVENAVQIYDTPEVQVFSIRKREGLWNSLACSWKQHESKSNNALEQTILGEVTIGRSAHERSFPYYHESTLSPVSKQKAIRALANHGFCVICDVFPKSDIMEWRDAVLSDLNAAINRLNCKGVDLLEPGKTLSPVSYRELAMREDLRVDLRYGPAIVKMRKQSQRLKSHRGILEIAQASMNPKGAHHRGNFGRWNFGGSGPDGSPQAMTVGEIGAVISIKGCADQAIHADTPHLFEHADLPPHYINLFIPATLEQNIDFNGDSEIGGTAFVAGSHKLEQCERLMDEFHRVERLRRIVRPSLRLGDALLFDTRVLHFGLANCSEERRPLLYINLTHAWFTDPKNWDNCKRLFPELD